MYVLFVAVFSLFALGANATSVSGVRDVPGRYIHSKTASHQNLADALTESVDVANIVPDTVIHSRPDYIKGFLVYDSFNAAPASVSENGPLNSKFTNLDRHMSDETNLKSWTRYLVENNDDTVELPVVPSVDEIDLEIEKFIEYLISNRNFKQEDLEFLQAVPFDLSYDEIEDELAGIKEREKNVISEDTSSLVVESSAASHFRRVFFYACFLGHFLSYL